jgi:hypothetical protein
MSEPLRELPLEDIPLRHRIAGRMPTVYAHNVVVQNTQHGVVLSFFETILPPTVLSDNDVERLKQEGILSECVARVTLSHSNFLAALEVMNVVGEPIREVLKRAEETLASIKQRVEGE